MMFFSMAVSILPVSGGMPEVAAMLPVAGGSNMQAGAGGFLVACGLARVCGISEFILFYSGFLHDLLIMPLVLCFKSVG